ncbi:MAG: DMT family transporter [Firmicutes bacterium]|nr:DMT family transporter [Bacillota bacterium]
MLHIRENQFHLSAQAGCLLMAALTIARGSSFLMSKQLLGSMEPLCLLGLRFLLAFLILFVLFFGKVCMSIRRDPGILGAALLLGGTYFVCMAAELIGLQYTTASTCSFLENSAIVIVPVLEAFLLRRLPRPVIAASTLITFIGIGLIVLRSGDTDAAAADAVADAAGTAAAGGTTGAGALAGIGLGEILCMVAALMYAAAIIITDRLSKKYEPMSLGILYVGFMGAMGLITSFIFETPHLPQTGGQWLSLVALAVLCTAFGFTMQPVAQKPLSSETTGIICALNPLTTAVLGWLLLGENLGLAGIAGAALILGGIVLPNLRH